MDPAAPALTGSQLYDALMAAIEPELVTAELPKLQARFAADTPQEKAKRIERYRKAYEAYDAAYRETAEEPWNALNEYASFAVKTARETHEEEENAQTLRAAEDHLSTNNQ